MAILKYIENPIPHIQAAQEAASRVIDLERQLLTLKAENAAIHQAKRISFGVTAGVFAIFAFLFCFGWLSVALHEGGMPPTSLALLSFLLFGILSACFGLLAMRKAHHE
jgi:hypothetical protein